MKLLLTSAGVTNQAIADTLLSLVDKDPADVRIGFVPTAANVEPGDKMDKDWFIRQFVRLREHGFVWVDVIDISAPGVAWQERLDVVDIVIIGGGNTFHLLDQVRITGFDDWLKSNINDKIYLGISAGSILVTPDISIAGVEPGDENLAGLTDTTALGLVPFAISPHSPDPVTYEANEAYFETIDTDLCCIDDASAIMITESDVQLIGEGCKVYKK